MTRLEFLSMSLSKGLKGVISIDGEQEIVTLKSIDTDGNEIWVSSDNWVYSSLNYDIKIICRKLSDITEVIEHCGVSFIPINKLNILSGGIYDYSLWINNDKTEKVELSFYTEDYESVKVNSLLDSIGQLIEWKFNLMDENEPFIDVNTLEVNPYK